MYLVPTPAFVAEHLNARRMDVLQVLAKDPELVASCQNYIDSANKRARHYRYTALEFFLYFSSDKIHGLLCDLENGCRLDGPSAQKKAELKACTGNPMYVARSVAAGYVESGHSFTPICSLDQPERGLYREAHKNCPQDAMRVHEDDDQHPHGGTFSRTLYEAYAQNPSAAYQHAPRHDVESVFWVIVVRLLRANPRDTEEDPHASALQNCFPLLSEHEIGGGPDLRTIFLGKKLAYYWRQLLHPDLAHCSALLEELAKQIEPEYAFLEPRVDSLHLHEAVQRILVKHISLLQREGLDIELDANNDRPVLVRSVKDSALYAPMDMANATRKHKPSAELEPSTKSKRQRMDSKAAS